MCVTFVFSALLEYALVNYASRSDAQRLARRKVQKQWEIDHCQFEPEHMEEHPHGAGASVPGAHTPHTNNGGGSFGMVSAVGMFNCLDCFSSDDLYGRKFQ